MTNDPAVIAEQREAIDRLQAAGHGRLLEALQDPGCYSSRGKLLIAQLARRLRCGRQGASGMLLQARAVFW
jgi:hypothetical protein